ncbi:MAG: radical SAM protein [Theionarchaea archaeon]|nr:radical SAM protein [Theionarchaea archaeon]MBU7037892.1 radical SAM protein [Theionarchaea archaeon]
MHPLKRRIVVQLKEDEYLLINPYSGLTDIVDAEALRALENGHPDLQNGVIRALRRRGHLKEEDDEEYLFSFLEAQATRVHKAARSTYLHVIVPTYQCNLRCPYCFEKHVYRKELKQRAIMDEKSVDLLFESVMSLDTESKEKCIVLYGGEPLQVQNKDIIQYILEKGEDLDYSFKVVTNGADLYHFVPALSETTVLKIQVTLDGPQPVHDRRRFRPGGKGTFHDIVRGVDACVEHELPIGIRINVDRENIDYMPEFGEFYKQKGWYPQVYAFLTNVHGSECVSYVPLISPEEFVEKIVHLFAEDDRMRPFLQTFRYPNVLLEHLFAGKEFKPRFWSCGAHTSILIYDPVGDIYPCYEAVGDERHKIGEYLPQLRFNDEYEYWRNRTVFAIPECRECNYSLLCGGGCAYGAYKQHGSIYSPYCDKTKYSLKYEIPYLMRLSGEEVSLSEERDWY